MGSISIRRTWSINDFMNYRSTVIVFWWWFPYIVIIKPGLYLDRNDTMIWVD